MPFSLFLFPFFYAVKRAEYSKGHTVMKKIALLVAVLTLVLLCTVSVFATDAKVLKGTPTVDGKLDDIYKQSGSLVVDSSKFVWGTKDKSKATSTTYYLYDADYLYCCTVVTDNTVVNTGKDIPSGWKADAIEMWLTVNGKKNKTSVDVENHTAYGTDPFTGCKQAVVKSSTGYVVELAVPVKSLGTIANGTKLPISMQLNDFFDAGAADGVAYGSQKCEDNLVFSDTAVVVTTAATTKAAATADAAKATTAAKTADASVIIAVVATVALAGAVVCKKKH